MDALIRRAPSVHFRLQHELLHRARNEQVGRSARVEVLPCHRRGRRPARSHESSPLIEVHRMRTTRSFNVIGMSQSDPERRWFRCLVAGLNTTTR
jgi:hypothetical protein